MRLTSVAGLLVLVAVLPALAQEARPSTSLQPEGTISGLVLDEHDQIVEHASVCTTTFSNSMSMTNCRTVTDQSGRFTIEHVPMDSYTVSASKEEDGYPGGMLPGPKVVLSANQPFAQVTLKLGPRSAILRGTVRDKATGKPIGPEGKLSITYVSVEGNESGSMTGSISGLDGAKLRANLPADREFIVFVSGAGYKTWFYVNDQSRPTLRLKSGEEKVLDVELEAKNTERQ